MMFLVPRSNLHYSHLNKTITLYHILTQKSPFSCSVLEHPRNKNWNNTQIPNCGKNPILIPFWQRYVCSSWYSSKAAKIVPKSVRKRIKKRFLAATKPVVDINQVNKLIEKLPPRFYPEDLHRLMLFEDDPLVCLELFNWASKQHRFKHNELTYEITIKRLGDARMIEEMNVVVSEVIALHCIGTESLYNMMISYFAGWRMLGRATVVFRHMKNNKKLSCRPTLKTYSILLNALMSKGTNTLVNHVYMENSRCLFRQMVEDGIEPDIFTLNLMIKGYLLASQTNDALRIFHQMGVVYQCEPNWFTYDCLIHGLCVDGRTKNARELCDQMKGKGFLPSCQSYNSVVNALALGGEIDEAVKCLWEIFDNRRSVDLITYRTVIDELCRQKNVKEARCLLEDLQGKCLIREHTYRILLDELEGNLPNMRSTC